MLRRIALVRIDVSEELIASFIRVTRIGKLGATLTNQPYPSTKAWDLALYSGHLKSHSITPTPLCIHNYEFHTGFLPHFVFLRSVLRLLVTANVPISPIVVTLMM
jgi:hypothetical protein